MQRTSLSTSARLLGANYFLFIRYYYELADCVCVLCVYSSSAIL